MKPIILEAAIAIVGVPAGIVRWRCQLSGLYGRYMYFNQERSLSSRPNFKLNRAAALAEWRGLCAG